MLRTWRVFVPLRRQAVHGELAGGCASQHRDTRQQKVHARRWTDEFDGSTPKKIMPISTVVPKLTSRHYFCHVPDSRAPPPIEMARRAVLAEAARALLSCSRRCVRCVPDLGSCHETRETSAPRSRKRRPILQSAPLTPTSPSSTSRPSHGSTHRAHFTAWTAVRHEPLSRDGNVSVVRGFPSPHLFRGYAQPARDSSKKTNHDLVLTDKCVSRLKQLASEEESAEKDSNARSTTGPLLRIAVDGGGCSGFQYAFSLDTQDNTNKNDLLFERGGVSVVVDDVSFQFVKGSTVDYVEEMIKSSFVIVENPNSDESCGCGVSFAAK